MALDQSRKKLSRLQNAALIEPLFLPTTQQECFKAICEAKNDIIDNIATCIDLREAEFKKKIKRLELSSKKSDVTLAVLLRRMHRVEEIKRLFAKLRAAGVKGDRRGVVALEIPVHPESVPKTCNAWRTIDVPSEIVEQLQIRNRKHFGQAHGSPFTVSPLADELGFCGNSESSDAILNGQYDSSPFQDNIQLLLQHLRLTQEIFKPRVIRQSLRKKFEVICKHGVRQPPHHPLLFTLGIRKP